MDGVGRRATCRSGGRDWRGAGSVACAPGQRRDLQLAAPRALLMLRALAIAAGIAAGREHEGGRGRRLRGEECVRIEDDEAAIEELAHFHATAGIGAGAGPGRDLEPTGPQPPGGVASDDPRIAAAQNAIEIARRWAPRGRGLRRGAREALNEGGQKLGQKRVGLLEGVDRAQAQFADEAILQSAPEPFDAALRLRRLRRDEPDAEILEHPPEVGGILLAAQLLGECPILIIAPEEAEAITVERHGDPYCRHVCASTVV
jgi:hypothetical protein